MTAVFLQSRLDSSRFPRKALAKLGNLTVLENCMVALNRLDVDAKVLVTEPESERELAPLADRWGWKCFVGSKLNVLDRFVQASRVFSVTTIVRATGDNPLVSPRWANELLKRHKNLASDYSGFVGAPVGSGVEIVESSALEEAWKSNPDEYEREHVSPFLYHRPERFRIDRPTIAEGAYYPEGRITLDTPQDFEYLGRIFQEFRPKEPIELEDLIPWLKSNPRT